MKKPIQIIAFGGAVAIAASVYAAQSVRQLVIDGKPTQINVTQESGHYMVPIEDVAKYFGYKVDINGTRATLTKLPNPAQGQPNQGQQSQPQDGSNGAAQVFANSGQQNGNSGQTGGMQGFADGSSGATANSLPGQNPQSTLQITANVGQVVSVNGFDYTITSIQDVGNSYKELYDQRQSSLHPKWKTDTLVVINMQVANRGTKPVQASIPSASDITAFDGKRIGYHANYLDEAQSSTVVASGSDNDDTLGFANDGPSNVVVAPGGVIKFAAIASVPKGDTITGVLLNLGNNGTSDSNSPTLAQVTFNRS